MKKRLYKSCSNKKIFGVCAGLSDYFNIDAVIIRLLWIVFAWFFGAGILLYIIAAIVMPYDTVITNEDDNADYEYAPLDD